MKRSWWIEALCCAWLCTTAFAAPPAVRVTLDVTLPQREAWERTTLYRDMHRQLLGHTIALLQSRLPYLRWIDSGTAQAHVHFVVEEAKVDDRGRRIGARPWRLRMVRTDLIEAPHIELRVAKGLAVHLLDGDERQSAQLLQSGFTTALDRYRGDGDANHFVATLLTGIAVAQDVEENSGKVDAAVQFDNLRAREDGTQLRAEIKGRPRSNPAANATTEVFGLIPDGPSTAHASYTDCTAVPHLNRPFQLGRVLDFAGGMQDKVSVVVWRYYKQPGSPTSNNTQTGQPR